MPVTSSLLRLLDGIASENIEAVTAALDVVSDEVMASVGDVRLLPEAVLSDPELQLTLIQAMLQHHPEWCKKTSTDGSLPLHFAAVTTVSIVNLLLGAYTDAAFQVNGNHKIPLHYAAREGKLDIVLYFLQKVPATASVGTDKGKLALHFAVGEGHLEIVQALLRVHPQGAALPTTKGKLPLHFAARWNHVHVSRALLQVYPDAVRALDWDQSLPLHDAARQGQYDTALLLVEQYPFGLLQSNLRSDIPLFLAARTGNVRLVALFVHIWAPGSRVVLQNATDYEKVDNWHPGILEILIRGAVDQLEGCTWMRKDWLPHLPRLTAEICEPAAPRPTKRTKCEGRVKSPHLDGLVQRVSPPPVAVAPHEMPRPFLPLHAALTAGASRQILTVVTERWPASVDLVDDQGRTPLHKAVTRCTSVEGAHWTLGLLRKYPGAALQRDLYGRLPLHAALVAQAHASVVRALVDLDPDMASARCETLDQWQNMTPIHMACEYDCELDAVYELVRRDPAFWKRTRRPSHSGEKLS